MKFSRFNLFAFLIFIALFVGVILLPTPFTRKIQSSVLGIFGFGTKAIHKATADKTVYNGVDLAPETLLKDPVKLAQDYADLYKEARELQVWKNQTKQLQEENDRLRRALDFKTNFRDAYNIVAARVIDRQSSTWWNTIVIDRGEKHGVVLEDPIVAVIEGGDDEAVQTIGLASELHIVGKVISLANDTSRVLLLTDEACQVSARVQGTNEKGIVMGSRVATSDRTPQLRLKFLSKDAPIDAGARVFSTGVPRKDLDMEFGVFPSGFRLGDVKSFRRRDTYGEAVIQPAVDFATLTDVFVLQPSKQIDFEGDAMKASLPPPEPEPEPEPEPVPSPTPGATPAPDLSGVPSATPAPDLSGAPSATPVPDLSGAPSATPVTDGRDKKPPAGGEEKPPTRAIPYTPPE